MSGERSLRECCLAEVVGTFLLIFFGCGAVHVAVLFGGLQGLWQVGIVWGLAIMLAIYTIGHISGAHINPAITIGLAFWGRFPRGRVVPYILYQFVGAILAAVALYGLFQGPLADFEKEHGIVRGEPESVLTAMCYGEYYMNPGGYEFEEDGKVDSKKLAQHLERTSMATAFLAELIGTAILAFVVVSTTSTGNEDVPHRLAPVFIGLTVAALICVLAPLTQACFNPARDFGPRIVAALAGWGQAALPGPNGAGIVVVYAFAPIIGSIVGVGFAAQLVSHDVVLPNPEDKELE
ncbi:MAG: aquaporin family protein [Planctomycetaceae bacterium]|nr:aquaporin family protein [Planctomycetaceae bacterium]MCB9951850.1 aquaporin family protein [Planctomycetaceae bacterium]